MNKGNPPATCEHTGGPPPFGKGGNTSEQSQGEDSTRNGHLSKITVVGAGLAGCEAAMICANAGIPVTLLDMKPRQFSLAHQNPHFAELVCSNSLKAQKTASAAGLLKAEMARLGSVCVAAAYECRVPAGGALAVDRDRFAAIITEKIKAHPLISFRPGLVERIPRDGITIIATGPLTAGGLAEDLAQTCGGYLSFYDAASPIVTSQSIEMSRAFVASRYDKGDADYINCPMDKAEYEAFHAALIAAKTAPLHEFDQRAGTPPVSRADIPPLTRGAKEMVLPETPFAPPTVYEGCMPVETLAKRGQDAIRFGPLKPVGLRDPATGRRPWAVVQLRKENLEGSLYNLVGFQTNLTFPEQRRVFSLIPALQNAEFVRYGVMHRNTFIDSPRLLNPDYSLKTDASLFFAGQITGVEGYMESAGSGILAGINAWRRLAGQSSFVLPRQTMLGALTAYITDSGVRDFQPMGANFGILPGIEPHIKNKAERYAALAERALSVLEDYL